MIKVFAINDVTDWWAGETADGVRNAAVEYYRETGMTAEDVEEELHEAPIELTDEQMRRLKFRDDDHPHDQPWTFAEQLQRMIDRCESFPCFFASTEW